MKRLSTFVAAAVLAVPAFAFAGQNAKAAPASSGGEKAAPAAPSGGSSASSPSSGGSGGGSTSSSHGNGGSFSGGGGGSHQGARAGATGGSGNVTTRAAGRTQSQGGSSDTGSGVPRHSRPSEGKPIVGTAAPRGPNNPRPGNTPVYVIPGYYGGYGFYDPWLYGGGMWGGYYGGYYDPWFGGGYVGQSTSSYTSSGDEGALKLKIKPNTAEVYVDGYYVGVVDDFDGIFQKLHLDAGTHRIEVRAEGYETLTFDVRVQADHTTTYQGELKRIQ